MDNTGLLDLRESAVERKQLRETSDAPHAILRYDSPKSLSEPEFLWEQLLNQ